ncbi:hypothetical protein IQ251_16360 [Saccharopolyspora sp. HNM0983]|uniref:Uncharacterized protein n=1 Tax=Saccharopolyspora montiporae TaxID=2781240 RepID=A0A929G0W1_9PSEU|nr:DUF5947 family protein [Saccharopolyspora sp. HNM0983]MBE9376025.1 hypothetical protein [Saccharopolyspora sp. HNM0983]
MHRARRTERQPVSGPRCEMCVEGIGERHAHVVDLESRRLLCTCRPCSYLFVTDGAAAGRYRAVPERHLRFTGARLSPQQWDELRVPVGLAFFFHNSRTGSTAAFYPGPAGATEAEVPEQAWEAVRAANPELAVAEPDVEAVLIAAGTAQRAEPGEPEDFECFLVPVDTCYELVGVLRAQWRGFDGGSEVRAGIERFFTGLRGRSREVPAAGDGGVRA